MLETSVVLFIRKRNAAPLTSTKERASCRKARSPDGFALSVSRIIGKSDRLSVWNAENEPSYSPEFGCTVSQGNQWKWLEILLRRGCN